MNTNQVKSITFSNYEQFQEELKKQVIKSQYNISIETVKELFNIKDIDLSPIYDNCNDLKIRIKGQWYNQNDLDTFLSQILLFKQIKSLDIFFFNKRVKYIDKLLQIASKINNVSLSFKHFHKLYLQNEYQEEINQIKQLQINMQDAFFIDIETRKRFADYLGTLSNLETLKIKQYNHKKGNLLELFRKIQPTTRIELSNQFQIETIESCDMIAQYRKQFNLNLKITDIDNCMIREYLREHNILDEQRYQNPIYLNWNSIGYLTLSYQEYELIDKVKSFRNHYVKISETQKTLCLKPYNNFSYFLKYFLSQVYDLFDKIKICNHFYQSYDDCYIEKYNKNSWKMKITINNDLFQIQQISNLVNFQVHINPGIVKIFPEREFIKQLLKQEYLIFLKISGDNIQQIKFQKDKSIQTIQDRSQTFLRYLVFQKFIQDLIPLPQQVFYDLPFNP